jgi:hypothetical protein
MKSLQSFQTIGRFSQKSWSFQYVKQAPNLSMRFFSSSTDETNEEEKEDNDQGSYRQISNSKKEEMKMMECNAAAAAAAIAAAVMASDKEVQNDIYHSAKSRPVSNMMTMENKPPSIQEPIQVQSKTPGKRAMMKCFFRFLFLSFSFLSCSSSSSRTCCSWSNDTFIIYFSHFSCF